MKLFWAAGNENKGMNVTKGMPEWEHVKWCLSLWWNSQILVCRAYKCSVVAGATVKDHLVGIHFMASNFLTTSSIENLGPLHPIRRLLRPHTYGAIEINLGAVKTLAVENGVAHR